MTPNDRQPRSDADLEPGADRFWGEFSRTRAGRSQGAEEETTDDGQAPSGEGDPADDGPERGHGHGHDGECLEWCPICRSAELIRTAVPPELRDQAEAFQREAVNVLKAFLSAYAERTAAGGDGNGPAEPEPRPADPPGEEPEGPRITEIPLD